MVIVWVVFKAIVEKDFLGSGESIFKMILDLQKMVVAVLVFKCFLVFGLFGFVL